MSDSPIHIDLLIHGNDMSRLATVDLDGVMLQRCLAAHEGEGWADVVTDLSTDPPATERRTGTVVVRPVPWLTRAILRQILAEKETADAK